MRRTSPRAVSRVLSRLSGCVPSLASSDQRLLRARAGTSGAPRSLRALARRLDVSPAAVRGRIGRAVRRLSALADSTGCATGAGPGAALTAAPAVAGLAGGAISPVGGERTQHAAASSGGGDGATDAGALEVVPVKPDHGSLRGLVDDPPPAVWILVPLVVLLLVTAAAVSHEVRRVTRIGGTVPPTRLGRWWRAARSRDRADRP